jgi:dTDP-4-amino-4,6-dideoxygalactose transaminase
MSPRRSFGLRDRPNAGSVPTVPGHEDKPRNVVPVLRPQLPPSDRLLPYLRRIDESRVYANWGPLVGDLESRLSQAWGLPAEATTSAGSGTAALVGAILANAGRAAPGSPMALIPALTFSATAVAAELCGYQPYLTDVDPETWMLQPEALADHPALDRLGVVVPVATFGRSVPQEPWRSFRERTGVPVVIDGSASFDRILEAPDTFLGEVPVVISFHATKSFATGEGGCVVSTDTGLVSRATQALNYGFRVRRESEVPSLNGKMSEYHAAVGLAELDGWGAKIRALEDVAARYRARFDAAALPGRLVTAPDVSACYVLMECSGRDRAERVEEGLRRSGVDYRFWYGGGLHRQSQFAQAPTDDLSVTDDLVTRLIGLPLAPDLSERLVERVVEALGAG